MLLDKTKHTYAIEVWLATITIIVDFIKQKEYNKYLHKIKNGMEKTMWKYGSRMGITDREFVFFYFDRATEIIW